VEKKNLPAFTISGTAQNRKQPGEHSGLLQIDLDNLNGALESVREKVKLDPHVAFGFVSPSGQGLKLGLRIDGQRHAESFLAAQAYFHGRYGLVIDRMVKDPLRLCFVSFDPDSWTSRDAVSLPLHSSPSIRLHSASCMSAYQRGVDSGERQCKAKSSGSVGGKTFKFGPPLR
jgi:hypothetical protein